MKITTSQSTLLKQQADLLVITATQNGETASLSKHDDGNAIDQAMDGKLQELLTVEKFSAALGKTRRIPSFGAINARAILILGIGEAKDCSAHDWRKLGALVQRHAKDMNASSIATQLHHGKIGKLSAEERAQAFVEGLLLGNYRYTDCKSEASTTAEVQCTIVTKQNAATKKAVARGEAIAGAIGMARDLINAPSNICTPQFIAERAKTIAKEGNISCKVMGKTAIAKANMRLLQAVSQGGNSDPVFIHMSYTPKGKVKKHIALVGKGITFDTGGYSLKPPPSMVTMKGDMGGAAVTLGVMQAIAALNPKVAVDAYVPSCENVVSAIAYRPDDVITSRNGKTVEIISTDAEGRLILADALDYATESEPDLIIDMATLTGACRYALGEIYTAVLGTDQKSIQSLIKTSEKTAEPMWQLPLVDQYRDGLTRGTVADTRNSGTSRAGTITAALFLQQFIRDTPWIHLDIAYSSWTDEEMPYTPKGGTGTPIRTLTEFLMALS